MPWVVCCVFGNDVFYGLLVDLFIYLLISVWMVSNRTQSLALMLVLARLRALYLRETVLLVCC